MNTWLYNLNCAQINVIREHRLHVRSDGVVWMKYISDVYGEREVRTKKKYPELYQACLAQQDFQNAFRISEYGHVIHKRKGSIITVGRLRNPLLWEDGYNDERYNNISPSSHTLYDGLVYGIKYTLRTNGDITFQDDTFTVLTDQVTKKMINTAAHLANARSGGCFYVKDNGVMIGVFGEPGRRIYIGRLTPTSDGLHHWKGWFPNRHQSIPWLD